MTTALENLLKADVLEPYEVGLLREWMGVLQEDCDMFGASPEDIARMTLIEDRIARAEGAS